MLTPPKVSTAGVLVLVLWASSRLVVEEGLVEKGALLLQLPPGKSGENLPRVEARNTLWTDVPEALLLLLLLLLTLLLPTAAASEDERRGSNRTLLLPLVQLPVLLVELQSFCWPYSNLALRNRP